MTCRVRSTRENRRFSCLEKVLEDFFHGLLTGHGMPPRERVQQGQDARLSGRSRVAVVSAHRPSLVNEKCLKSFRVFLSNL